MIKAIATDMDGTFLNSQSTYDQARFLTVYAELKRRGIAATPLLLLRLPH